MDFQGVEIVCPFCKNDLRQELPDGQRLDCIGCRRQFPVVVGIPDLRTHPDPYIDLDGDRAKGLELAALCEGRSFEAAVDLYYSQADKVTPAQARLFKRGLRGAVSRTECSIDRWEAHGTSSMERDTLLDIGCGTAPLLVVAARRYHRVVGIDIALRWLVIARRRLEETRTKAPLIAACAEALPFPDAVFTRVVASSVLEHLSRRDQTAAMAECHRVTRPHGCLFVSTPNRFSLGPDPHSGLWCGGYLPRRLVDTHIRRQGGNPPHRHLLSSQHLRRLIESAGFDAPRIYVPDISSGQREHLGALLNPFVEIYHAAMRLPGGRHWLKWMGPTLHAVAHKPADRDR